MMYWQSAFLLAAELDYSSLGPTGMLREGQLESQMSKDNDEVSMHRTPGH